MIIIMKEDCENCFNNEICKWCLEFSQINEEVSKITSGRHSSSPIKVSLQCNHFKRKNQKQDGFSTQVGHYR